MSVRRMNVDIPAEIYEQFKQKCAKNHVLVKDEIFKFLCASLDGATIEGSPIEKHGEAISEEICETVDSVVNASMEAFEADFKKDLEAELKPIREKLDGLKPIEERVERMRAWINAPRECSKMEQFEGINEKLKVVGKLLESVGNGVIMGASMWCVDDIKGLTVLGVEPKPYTLEHMKRE